MHVKQQIREAVGTILEAAPTNWKTVKETRLPSDRDIFPYLMAYCESEVLDPLYIHSPIEYMRDIGLVIKGHALLSNDTESFEDSLDNILEEIEQTLTEPSLKAQLSGVQSLILNSTDSEITDDDDRTYATVTVNYTVRVNTTEGTPTI